LRTIALATLSATGAGSAVRAPVPVSVARFPRSFEVLGRRGQLPGAALYGCSITRSMATVPASAGAAANERGKGADEGGGADRFVHQTPAQ
jgi:hypothetical protein